VFHSITIKEALFKEAKDLTEVMTEGVLAEEEDDQ
jgi:hypothetical protein